MYLHVSLSMETILEYLNISLIESLIELILSSNSFNFMIVNLRFSLFSISKNIPICVWRKVGCSNPSCVRPCKSSKHGVTLGNRCECHFEGFSAGTGCLYTYSSVKPKVTVRKIRSPTLDPKLG